MDQPLLDVMQARHSVRAYRDTPITGDTLAALQACIEDCNRQSGLHIQLVREEPRAFDGFMAHYGKFSGVKNYIAMVGKKAPRWNRPAATGASGWCCGPRPWG